MIYIINIYIFARLIGLVFRVGVDGSSPPRSQHRLCILFSEFGLQQNDVCEVDGADHHGERFTTILSTHALPKHRGGTNIDTATHARKTIFITHILASFANCEF